MNIDGRRTYNPDPAYLRMLIKQSRLSQREIAKRLVVSQVTLFRWLSAEADGKARYPAPFTAQVVLEQMASAAAQARLAHARRDKHARMAEARAKGRKPVRVKSQTLDPAINPRAKARRRERGLSADAA